MTDYPVVAFLCAAGAFTTVVLAEGGDTIAEATEIAALPFVDAGTTLGFNDDADEVCPYEGSTSPDVFYKYTPEADELVDIRLGGRVLRDGSCRERTVRSRGRRGA